MLVPSDPLERFNGALTTASPWKAKPRSCTVFGLKPMGKLITLDKYLSVRLNQGLAWSSYMVLELKPMGKLITLDKYLSVRQN